jgi:regulator of replication initiation timing
MIDSFITYDPNPEASSSPSYFTKHIDDIFKYNYMDAETCGFLPNPSMDDEIPKCPPFDQFSHGSAFSTNPSSKHSPEYTPNMEDQGAEEGDYVCSQIPPITRKGIKKHYEPIIDCGKVYRYEDSASEYRKARKRIQNRESASRVRNRKKTHVEELDEEIEKLEQEKADLRAHNASLITENNLLKQQVAFLERMVSRNPAEEMLDNTEFSIPDGVSRTDNSDSILHLINKSDEDMESQSIGCKYFRVAPSQKFKRHVALLGVFTLLLCVYGLVPRSETNSVQLFAVTKYMFAKPTSNAVGIKIDNHSSTPSTLSPDDVLKDPKDGDQGGFTILWAFELIAVFSYIAYFIYVAMGVYKRWSNNTKASVYNSLP